MRSWLLELLHTAFEEHGNKLDDIAPWVEDSGEGRWTIAEAIAENVPAPVISAALFARFASRDEINFAAKVSAALRNQFGGHAIKAMAKAEGIRGPAIALMPARRTRSRRASRCGGRPIRARS